MSNHITNIIYSTDATTQELTPSGKRMLDILTVIETATCEDIEIGIGSNNLEREKFEIMYYGLIAGAVASTIDYDRSDFLKKLLGSKLNCLDKDKRIISTLKKSILSEK